MKTKALILMAVSILTGCNPPTPISDAQVAAVVARCKELGMAARVFSGATNIADCVPVERN